MNEPRSPNPTTWVVRLTIIGSLFLGCDEPEPVDPIVGSWRSADRIAGEHNQLDIGTDLEGESTIHFYFDGELYNAGFDVEAYADGGRRYELEFSCQGDCSFLDFTASCKLDVDDLECEGDGGWEQYVFEWEAF